MMKDISDNDLAQIRGGDFWGTLLTVVETVVEYPVGIIFDNFINPSKVGDDPLTDLNAGSGASDETRGGAEGAGGVGG